MDASTAAGLMAHQDNDMARIFQGDASVFTLSLHSAKNFPLRKEARDLGVDLPDGCGDDEYLQALDQAKDVLERRLFLALFAGANFAFNGCRAK